MWKCCPEQPKLDRSRISSRKPLECTEAIERRERSCFSLAQQYRRHDSKRPKWPVKAVIPKRYLGRQHTDSSPGEIVRIGTSDSSPQLESLKILILLKLLLHQHSQDLGTPRSKLLCPCSLPCFEIHAVLSWLWKNVDQQSSRYWESHIDESSPHPPSVPRPWT